MKRFAASVIGLIGLWGIAIAAILLTGRAAMPNEVQGFGQCDSFVCFAGITPGVTAWDEARTLLVEKDYVAAFYPSLWPGKIGRVRVDFLPDRHSTLMIGVLLKQYGVPCGISIYYVTGVATLRYPDLLANVILRDQSHLSIASPVYEVWLSDPAFHSKVQPDPCLDNITGTGVVNTRWLGFASIQHYRSTP